MELAWENPLVRDTMIIATQVRRWLRTTIALPVCAGYPNPANSDQNRRAEYLKGWTVVNWDKSPRLRSDRSENDHRIIGAKSR